VGHTQRGVLDITGFFTKDGAQQALFRGQLFFAFGGDFTDQDVIGTNFSANTNNASFVEVTDGIIANIGDLTGNLFGTKLGITGFHFILFNMDTGVAVFLDQAFRDQDGIFKVEAFPWEQRNGNILTQRQFSIFRGGRIHDHVALVN